MQTDFQAIIKERALFTAGEKLLAAVSGGVDSVVLAHLLHKSAFHFAIAHCNFMLRGKEAMEDERFVNQLAKKLKVEFFSIRFETEQYASENKLSIQMAARELRYNWFRNLQAENNFDLIATAHHSNDNIETVLLNLTRGSGFRGLCGIPEKENKIVRPLLNFSREQIEQYALDNNISYREDSSNYEEKYARNLIRKKVIPSLKKINPSLERTFTENTKRLQDAASVLSSFINEKTKELSPEVNGEIHIDLNKFKKEKYRDFLLYELLHRFGFQSAQLNTLRNLLDSSSGKTLSSPTHVLVTGRNELIIRKKENDDKENKTNFPSLTFEVTENKNFKFPTDKNIACLDLSKIGKHMLLRRWKQGDRFQPLGMKSGSKKLSDFFVSEKMSLFEKQDALVLEANGKIAWIVGRRISEEFAVTDTTEKILIVRLK